MECENWSGQIWGYAKRKGQINLLLSPPKKTYHILNICIMNMLYNLVPREANMSWVTFWARTEKKSKKNFFLPITSCPFTRFLENGSTPPEFSRPIKLQGFDQMLSKSDQMQPFFTEKYATSSSSSRIFYD
jgi:hypothetical protein